MASPATHTARGRFHNLSGRIAAAIGAVALGVAVGPTDAAASWLTASVDHSSQYSRASSGTPATALNLSVGASTKPLSTFRVAPQGPIAAASSAPCDPVVGNPVACENTLPGTPESVWNNDGDSTIVGFTTDISVNRGQTVHLKINTDASNYSITIYRMGWYGGRGARAVATVRPSAALPQAQPSCVTDANTGLIDCGNWAESASWAVPSKAVSGVYMAALRRSDTGGQSLVVFVVRDDSSHSDLLMQTSDTTWEAYNDYGGNSLYSGTAPAGRAYKVSYNRPLVTRLNATTNNPFYDEYPMVRFLEGNGYDLSYMSEVDTDRRGSILTQHKIFVSVGHDEYWSGAQRANVEAARAAGVNLAFFSGNEGYWKTRWEPSIDGGSTPYRTLVSYKETAANSVIDPADPPTWTGTWRDPRFSPPADGGRPENALSGTISTVMCCTSAITVPASFAHLRFWRNTSVARLQPGQTATLAPSSLGYEWDEDLDNGARPNGLFDLSSTTQSVPQRLVDYGNTVAPGTATHSLTLYRAPSGALIFGAGTVQWSWGLDGHHDETPNTPNSSMQQATVNLLADMSARPVTLRSPLVSAARSTDTVAPTSTISTPTGGTFASGSTTTIAGTATDAGGGVVAAVELSTDGGTTWHRATGTTTWSYTWTVNGSGSMTLRSRAIDDSGNIETPSAGVSVRVTCPCSIWGQTVVPTNVAVADGSAKELGVRFRADVDGYISGIRFFKQTGNTGTHVGNLWSNTGQPLASATFGTETSSGWQSVSFGTPVPVHANTTYVASYFAPVGKETGTPQYFLGGGVDNAPLHGLRDGLDGADGLFRYTATSAFPNQSYHGPNYWVDVLYTTGPDILPPVISATTPASGTSGVAPTTALSATFNEPVQPGSIHFVLEDPYGSPMPGSTSYAASTRSLTFQPSTSLGSGTTYTGAVSATDLAGNAMPFPYVWSFTVAGPRTCPCSVWPFSATPQTTAANDTSPVELGVKVRADVDGYITGIRFYKGTGNTGVHVGNLWTSSGTLLASALFAGETATGWQQVTFSGGIHVTAGTTYVASYFAPNGHYALTQYGLSSSGADAPPLHVLANGIDGGDGVFHYGSSSGFPTSSFGTNYWVDVVFDTHGTPDTTPPSVSSQNPGPGASGAPVTGGVAASFSEAVQPGSITFTLTDSGGHPVSGAPSYDPNRFVATFTPSSSLVYSSAYTASVSATDLSGNAMPAPVRWSFTTGAPLCPCTVRAVSSAPSPPESGDGGSVEVGVKIRADVAGVITGIRFYKGADNLGPHVGNLWTASGTLLASAVLTGETTSGWEQVNFPTPVPVSANTTYIASYFAPNGHYSLTPGGLSSGIDSPPLHALADGVDGHNGVFAYGGASGFPQSSYNAGDYWVDVVFDTTHGTPDTSAPAVSGTYPASAANDVPVGAAVAATFTKDARPGSVSLAVTGPGGTSVTGVTSYDVAARTARFQPALPLAATTQYAATVSAVDVLGDAMQAPASWSFTTGVPSCPCSIRPGSSSPGTSESSDTGSLELGVKFRSDVDGSVTGIRFYKGPDNTGIHIGNLWNASGTLLASGTFANETASGWQQLSFATPVSVSANTTYVASYFAPNGHYSVTAGGLSSALDAPPLHALANGVDGPNGVFAYGASSSFPQGSYNAGDYWVDVTFDVAHAPDTTPPSVVATYPPAGVTTVPPTTALIATFSEDVQPSSASLTLQGPSGAIAGTTVYDAATRAARFLPSAPLAAPSTAYTAAASATDFSGNTMSAPFTWSLTTADTAPPAIAAIAVTPNGSGSVVVAWTTDKPSDSRVDYGTDASSLFCMTATAATTNHALTLTGLSPGATYVFRVTSRDALGNVATSPDRAAPPLTFTSP